MPTAAEQAAIDRLQEMSPARRAFQLFTGTLANAGNKATGGAIGALGDLVRGTALGTTGSQIAAQVGSVSPLAAATSDTVGTVAGLKGAMAAFDAARAVPTAIAAARSAGVGQGLRVLTNTAGPGLIPVAEAGGTALTKGAAAKGAGILGLLGLNYANSMGADAPAATPTARTDGLQLAGGVQETGPAVARTTPQDLAMEGVRAILTQPGGFTLRQFEGATGALPQIATANAKVSNKDKVYSAASGIADTLYQAQLGQASKLTGDAKDAAVLAATEQYRKNLIETLGVDPSKQALAALAAQQAE